MKNNIGTAYTIRLHISAIKYVIVQKYTSFVFTSVCKKIHGLKVTNPYRGPGFDIDIVTAYL